MNRETKRMLQRQGQIGPDGAPSTRRPATTRPAPRPAHQRTSPREFTREVRAELRKVAWPTRSEVANYTLIVLIALVVMTSIVFGLDYLFSQFVLFLFE